MKDAFLLKDYSWWLAALIRALIVIGIYFFISCIIYVFKGFKYRDTIRLRIGNNSVTIKYADIFEENAWRVIPVDTHFQTVVDNKSISKSSLHGQLVEKHGNADDINKVVMQEAVRLKIFPGKNGEYSFRLGTAIPYIGKDGTYIMLALNELNEDQEAHTTLAKYENTLIRAWKEINRVYAGNDIAIPLLGNGITRFDDDQGDAKNLLRCILCTLNTSKIQFNSNISIVIFDKNRFKDDISLYEFRDIVR